MAVRSGFFNAVQSGSSFDRLYDCTDFSSLFDGIIQDGVFQGYKEGLVVRPGSGFTVVVNTGRAWFNHTWTDNTTDLVLDVDAPDLTYKRIDSVVLTVDFRESVRSNSITMIKGNAGVFPAPPILIHNELTNQYPLAYVTVTPRMSAITAGSIRDMRGTSWTPFVKGATINPDISNTLNHWNSSFEDQEKDFEARFKEFMDTATGNPGLAVPITSRQIDDMFASR